MMTRKLSRKNFWAGITILLLGLSLLSPHVYLAKAGTKESTELGAPVYPGWILKRKDELVDAKIGVAIYKNEFFSNDSKEDIVNFYEEKTKRKGFNSQETGIYVITTQGGTQINIFSPEKGIPQVHTTKKQIIKTWQTLITIMKTDRLP